MKPSSVVVPAFLFLAGTASAAEPPYPVRVTEATRADRAALAALEKPGHIFFSDNFESAASQTNYFEIAGLKEGHVVLGPEAGAARGGRGAIRFTAPGHGGEASLTGAALWFGPDGHDRVYFRRTIRFADDYDQGDLNHVGGSLTGVAGTDKWAGMGSAGLRPNGDDRFSSAFEPWKDWGRVPPPGYMFCYTYWMDMKRDPDGHFWGNNLTPAEDDRLVIERGRWYCLEHMIRANDAGRANGELAAWIDGKLYLHYTGFRWRSTDAVRIKRAYFGLYVHHAKKANTVWYDDIALSTGYIGPARD